MNTELFHAGEQKSKEKVVAYDGAKARTLGDFKVEILLHAIGRLEGPIASRCAAVHEHFLAKLEQDGLRSYDTVLDASARDEAFAMAAVLKATDKSSVLMEQLVALRDQYPKSADALESLLGLPATDRP